MVCFQVSSLPSLGDYITYQGDKYQILGTPSNCGMRGLLKATGRYTTATTFWEKVFYFELKGE